VGPGARIVLSDGGEVSQGVSRRLRDSRYNHCAPSPDDPFQAQAAFRRSLEDPRETGYWKLLASEGALRVGQEGSAEALSVTSVRVHRAEDLVAAGARGYVRRAGPTMARLEVRRVK